MRQILRPAFLIAIGAIGYALCPELIKLKFDYTYNVANIFNLFATLTAAYFITTFLNKRISERRVEKDIPIAILKDLVTKINNLQSRLDEIKSSNITHPDRQEFIKKFREFNNDLQHISGCITEYKLLSQSDSTVKKISIALLNFKQALTLYPEKGIHFGNCFSYYIEVRSDLYKLILKINRC